MTLYQKLKESVQFVSRQYPFSPEVAIVSGTGLSGFQNLLTEHHTIEYGDIPHFPSATAPSHRGKLHLGKLSDKVVVILDGRFHYYEGYSMQNVAYSVRVARLLGAKSLVLTNVSGSVNPDLTTGSLCVVTDHINWMFDNPLIGQNDDRLGIRFPDMTNAYDANLIAIACHCAKLNNIELSKGVYAAMVGPSLETPAEYNFLHDVGADMVGMSTVPEVIAARHMDMNVLALSVISNICYPPSVIKKTTVEDVIEVASKAGDKVQRLVHSIVSLI